MPKLETQQQAELHERIKVMAKAGLSRREIAQSVGRTESRVSQIIKKVAPETVGRPRCKILQVPQEVMEEYAEKARSLRCKPNDLAIAVLRIVAEDNLYKALDMDILKRS